MTLDSAAKTIRLIDDATLNEYKVTVLPGDTFAEVLKQAGLDPNHYTALKPDSTEYAPMDVVYKNVDENGKIHLTLKAEVGGSLEGWIRSTPYIQRLLSRWGLVTSPPTRLPVTVSTASTNYAKDMGWQTRKLPEGILHFGYYYALGKRWHGSVLEQDGRFIFKIADPPWDDIKETKWAGCFKCISAQGLIYQIHFQPQFLPKDASSGIAAINHMLVVCLNRSSRRKR